MQFDATLDEANKQITTLKAQLAKHDGHTADCASRGGYYTQPGGGNFTANPCDCGWAEIEKGN